MANTGTANNSTLAGGGPLALRAGVMRHRELPRRAAQAGELQELARGGAGEGAQPGPSETDDRDRVPSERVHVERAARGSKSWLEGCAGRRTGSVIMRRLVQRRRAGNKAAARKTAAA